jgi:hypothetical protein
MPAKLAHLLVCIPETLAYLSIMKHLMQLEIRIPKVPCQKQLHSGRMRGVLSELPADLSVDYP